MPVYLNILFIFLLFLLNAVFAMYEIAMVSSRKTRLQQRLAAGQKGAGDALELLADTDTQYLSAIQIMITMIDTLAGGIGGASLADPLANVLKRVSFLAPIADTTALISVVLIITYFSIVIGELIPKRIAVSKPENVVTRLSPFIKGLSRVFRPLTKLLSSSTNLGIRIFKIDITQEPSISEEELKGYMEEGLQTGVFNAAEQEMVGGVFRLSDRRVDALMTPHTELVWINLEDDREEIVQNLKHAGYSRLPVARGDIDRIVGMVNTKELVGVDIYADDFNVLDYVTEPVFLPGNMMAVKAVDKFRETGIHQALVMDEYGGVEGMVTLYDVLESIVGDIPQDEHDYDPEVVIRSDGSWSFDGLLAIDELKELLGVTDLPQEDKAGFQTLSGFVMNQMGSIPRVGESFVLGNFRFEVADMDGHRVDRVIVTDLTITPD